MFEVPFKYQELLDAEKLELMKNEFSHIKNAVYLDHGGATLYSKSQLDSAINELKGNLFSNPHSRNPSSSITTDVVDNIRQMILQHFCTTEDEYTIIFTSGATEGLKLVAESFSFNGGVLAYLEECHTSVIGMREYLIGKEQINLDEPNIYSGKKRDEERAYCISKSAMERLMKSFENVFEEQLNRNQDFKKESNALCVFPAQCNFSGYKYPLDWITKIQEGSLDRINGSEKFYINDVIEREENEIRRHKWHVCLDAASFVASNKLNLSLHKPDFVTISFYKMFGWPTGLGALFIRNERGENVLEKQYFGGGTVNIAIPSLPFHVKRTKLNEKFEDGSIPFLSILGVRHGLDALKKFYPSMDSVRERTFKLAQYLYKNLSNMKYRNCQRVARIYADTEYNDEETQGPVVTFNLLRPNGDIVGYSEMEQIAYLHDVHLRYGCFCNSGACRRHLGLTDKEILKHYEAGHVCGDMRDIIDGHPTGAVRVSIGYMTTRENIDFLLQLIFNCWIKPYNAIPSPMQSPKTSQIKETTKTYGSKLSRIFVYPIKSCAPFEVKGTWSLGAHGLLYDREWLIVNSNGVPLTAKREPKLILIQPTIDISRRELRLHFQGDRDDEDICIPLDISSKYKRANVKADICNSKVCGDLIVGIDCGQEASQWLEKVLGRFELKLIRMSPDQHRKPRNSLDEISLANQSQFLLLSLSSVHQLARELISNGALSSLNMWMEDFPLNYDGAGEWEIIGRDQPKATNGQQLEEQVIENLMGRFRGNFVVESGENLKPFEEEQWTEIQIGAALFKSGGPCVRCATICLDPYTGTKSSEPLLTLSRTREGRPNFGIHLYANNKTTNTTKFFQTLRIGDTCHILRHEYDTPSEKFKGMQIIENID